MNTGVGRPGTIRAWGTSICPKPAGNESGSSELEFAGIGFLVGASFAQAVTENVAYALLALAFELGSAGLWVLIAGLGRVTVVAARTVEK